MKNLLAILITSSLLLISCSGNSDEVNIYPVENDGSDYWCEYTVTKTNSPRITVGTNICVKCSTDQSECPETKKFVQGGIWYEATLKSIICGPCSQNDYFAKS